MNIKFSIIVLMAVFIGVGCSGISYSRTETEDGKLIVEEKARYNRLGKQDIKGFSLKKGDDGADVSFESSEGSNGEIFKFLNNLMEALKETP